MDIHIFQMKILKKIFNFAWNKSPCSISKLYAGCMSVNFTTIYNLSISFQCAIQHGKILFAAKSPKKFLVDKDDPAE